MIVTNDPDTILTYIARNITRLPKDHRLSQEALVYEANSYRTHVGYVENEKHEIVI